MDEADEASGVTVIWEETFDGDEWALAILGLAEAIAKMTNENAVKAAKAGPQIVE